MMRRMAFVLVGSMALVAVAAEPAAPEKVKGDLWEVTSQMSMEGAPVALPTQKSKVCIAKDDSPLQADDRHGCTNSDMKKDGAKVTWKTVCEGDMTGDGEITFTDDDNYTGSIKFTTPHGNMTTKLTGKRLGTDCEVKKK